MKTLLIYLKPYKWLVVLTLFLAALNIGFSLTGSDHFRQNRKPVQRLCAGQETTP